MFSVVIPAHNEAKLLPGLLTSLMPLIESHSAQVVVAANGCTDETASMARRFEGVEVVEISAASKIDALNAADSLLSSFPRIYLDADVRVSRYALEAVVSILDETGQASTLVAAPSLRIATANSSLLVKMYYSVWELTDYRQDAPIGSGFIGVSATGRERWDGFPSVIADDEFVRLLFHPDERLVLSDAYFEIDAPRTLSPLIRRGVRIRRGNIELSSRGDVNRVSRASGTGFRYRVTRRPRLWLSALVYLMITLLIRTRARRAFQKGKSVQWSQDRTTRCESNL